MKITPQKSNKKKLILITSGLVLLALVSSAGYYFWSRQEPSSEKTNLGPATAQEKADGDATKKKTIDTSSSENGTSSSEKTTPDTNAQGSAVQPSTPQTAVPIRVTAKSQNGNLYQLRTQIDGVFSTGSCTLTITKGQQTITKTASIQALAQTSTCQGFDIPTSELSPGTWNIQLSFTSDQSSGSIGDTIEVK